LTPQETYIRNSTKAFGAISYARSSGLIGTCLLALAARTVNAAGETPALKDQPKEIALASEGSPSANPDKVFE
jgi:hypothetical protein